jgi:hypothetical protein
MTDDILKFNLGKDAEIESINSEGKYLLRYTKVNGNINMIAWSEHGPNECVKSDVNAQKIILKLQKELDRRKSLL